MSRCWVLKGRLQHDPENSEDGDSLRVRGALNADLRHAIREQKPAPGRDLRLRNPRVLLALGVADQGSTLAVFLVRRLPEDLAPRVKGSSNGSS